MEEPPISGRQNQIFHGTDVYYLLLFCLHSYYIRSRKILTWLYRAWRESVCCMCSQLATNWLSHTPTTCNIVCARNPSTNVLSHTPTTYTRVINNCDVHKYICIYIFKSLLNIGVGRMFMIVWARFEVLYSYIVMISIFKMPSTYGISYYIGLSTYALCYCLIPCPLFFQLFQTRKKDERIKRALFHE